MKTNNGEKAPHVRQETGSSREKSMTPEHQTRRPFFFFPRGLSLSWTLIANKRRSLRDKQLPGEFKRHKMTRYILKSPPARAFFNRPPFSTINMISLSHQTTLSIYLSIPRPHPHRTPHPHAFFRFAQGCGCLSVSLGGGGKNE